MKTIQETVEIIIKRTPFIEEAMQEKLINVSSLARIIEPEVSQLLGKEVKTIDTDILQEVIDKRIITINNKQYELKILKIILTDILEMWIEIKPINK